MGYEAVCKRCNARLPDGGNECNDCMIEWLQAEVMSKELETRKWERAMSEKELFIRERDEALDLATYLNSRIDEYRREIQQLRNALWRIHGSRPSGIDAATIASRALRGVEQ